METAARRISHEDFTGPVQGLQPTGSGISSQVTFKKIKQAVPGFEHFPEQCGKCNERLSHADLLGHHAGTIFIVKGYICPACGHTVGTKVTKTANTSHTPFDWTRLRMPRAGKEGSAREVMLS